MLEIIKSIILGIIQGITEWLPISSTGHMILFDEFLKLNVNPDFKDMFLVIIQLASIFAVILLFWKKMNPFSRTKTLAEKRGTWSLWCKAITACLPAAVIGALFDDYIDEKLYKYYIVAAALIVYGALFIIMENKRKNTSPKITSLEDLSYRTAILIGMFQMLALIPGTSRSGSTILGAALLGCSRTVAAEFSFFMAVPVMFGASALKIFKYAAATGFDFTGTELVILLAGCVTAFLVSLAVIRFLMDFIKKYDFKLFGYYRIALGAAVLVYFVAEAF